MAKKSAGILLYRLKNGTLEIFLVHPGGPFWAKRDLGAWSIPKGEIARVKILWTLQNESFEKNWASILLANLSL